jgi:hypothetical protein
MPCVKVMWRSVKKINRILTEVLSGFNRILTEVLSGFI